MRRSLSVLGVCLVVAASVVTVALAGSGASIRVLSVRPLVVGGAQFKPYERLTVTAAVMGGVKFVKQVTATRQGNFKVTVGNRFAPDDPCGLKGLIRVIRSGGRTLQHTLRPKVACRLPGP
jgi:hypothetical protein